MLIADCSMVDVIGSIVISLSRCCLSNDEGPAPPPIFFLEPPLVNTGLKRRSGRATYQLGGVLVASWTQRLPGVFDEVPLVDPVAELDAEIRLRLLPQLPQLALCHLQLGPSLFQLGPSLVQLGLESLHLRHPATTSPILRPLLNW